MKDLYFIALLPPKDLSDRIHEIRLRCSEKFDVHKALRPPVHITLYPPFRFENAYEKQMIHILKQQTQGLFSFRQLLKNYGHFRKEVVFINALVSPELMKLQEAISSVLDHEISSGSPKLKIYHPHVTIAYRDLTPARFDAIWQEYKEGQFAGEFKADHVTVLKHDQLRWKPIANIALDIPPDYSR